MRALGGLLVGGGLLAFACAQESAPVGPGEECFVASDCQPGLVCVPQRGGARQCSSDLSQVMGRPPPDGAAADTSAGDADATSDAPDDSPVVDDTGAQDTGVDTGSMDAAADG